MTRASDCRHLKEHLMAQQTGFRPRACIAAMLVLIAALGALAMPASTAASEALQPEQGPGVAISAFLFEPATMTVNAGETVSYTFDSPGTYIYYCEIHPAMSGQITVIAPE